MARPQLSVNVNKYALLRNSRGRNAPDLLESIDMVLAAGAHGITIHPRRDERHVRLADVPVVMAHLAERHPGVELNIECEPHESLIDLVLAQGPAQCTLVPVRPGEVTSDHGFDLPAESAALRPIIERLHQRRIRVSLFADCVPDVAARARDVGADRIELYTGPFAWAWGTDRQAMETQKVWDTAAAAVVAGVGLNAGHDLDRHNLLGLRALPGLAEVSIGHAQICRALEVGTAQSVKELLAALSW